jgi:Zn-dependent protease
VSQWSYRVPSSTYSYARPYHRAQGRLSTSAAEIRDLSIAAIVIAVDVAFIVRSFALFAPGTSLTEELLVALGVGAAASLSAFVAHEMAHKVAAQHRGYWAEFRRSDFGLLISVVFSFLFGLLFAAPGATVVQDVYDRDDWGWISLAGPATNFVAGTVTFGAAAAFATFGWLPVLVPWLAFLAYLNGVFAAFNLIPFGPLDGRKVWAWNRGIWMVSFAVAAAFAIAAFAVLNGFISL